MNISDFEKHIHHTFHQQEVPLNTKEFANSLFARMDKKEKKYPFGWIFGALMLGISGLGGTYFYANSQMFSEDPKGMLGKNIAGAEVKADTEDKIEVKVKNEVEKKAETEAEVKVETKVKVKDKVKNEAEVKVEDKVETENEANNEVKTKIEAEVKDKVEKKIEVKVKNRNAGINQNSAGKMMSGKPDQSDNNKIKDEAQGREVVANENSFIKSPEVQGLMFQLPLLARKDQNSLSTLYGFKPKRRKVECPTFQNKRKVLFFIQPEIGISSPIKSLEEKIIDNSEVTALRKENEKPLEGLHVALYAGVHLGRSPFYVKTRFAYSRLAERMDLSYNTTRMDTTFGIISVTQSQSGDTLTVIYGNIITERTVSGQKIKHYYHHLYDIPLCVGYQYPLTPRLMLGAEVGLVFNVGLRPKGEILTTPTEFAPVNPILYERSLGLGWRAGLDVEYALTGKISLGLNARFNGFTRSFSNEIATYNQNYLVPGVFLYGKYYFRTLPIRH